MSFHRRVLTPLYTPVFTSDMTDIDTHAERLARTLRASATLTALVGDDETARDLFDAVRTHAPVVGIVSRTGRTLHLGVATEDTRRFGHNDRINLRTHLTHAGRVRATDPERVWC